MSLRRKIRQTHHSGSWAYAVVLEVNLGYATVQLAQNGAKLSNLPIVGGLIEVDDTVIVDYSGGIIPVARPLKVLPPEEPEIPIAAIIPELEDLDDEVAPDPVSPNYWTSGFHSVKAYQFGGTFTTVTGNEWTPIRFSHVDWDTDEFFDDNYPYYVTVPAPGYYFCIADVCWEPCGSGAGVGWPPYSPYLPVDVPASFKISIQSNAYGDMGYEEDYPIARIGTAQKAMQCEGQGPLEADERIQVLVWQNVESYLNLIQTVPITPRLTVVWMGNTGGP